MWWILSYFKMHIVETSKRQKRKEKRINGRRMEEKKEKDEDHQSRWSQWWWCGPLVGPSSTGALSGHSALLFSVFLFSLPFPLAVALSFFIFVPLSPASMFVRPVFLILCCRLPLTGYQCQQISYRGSNCISMLMNVKAI